MVLAPINPQLGQSFRGNAFDYFFLCHHPRISKPPAAVYMKTPTKSALVNQSISCLSIISQVEPFTKHHISRPSTTPSPNNTTANHGKSTPPIKNRTHQSPHQNQTHPDKKGSTNLYYWCMCPQQDEGAPPNARGSAQLPLFRGRMQ